MKKSLMTSALFGLAMMGAATAANITVYYSPTCPHCHHAREFIENTLVYEYPELVVQNVDVTNQDNIELFRTALNKCEYESGGVPVLVVGEKCFQGYADFMQQQLRDAIEADLTAEAKAKAAENRKALTDNADAFKSEHAERIEAVSEYNAADATASQKKNGSIWFYGVLIALVAGLGFVLIRKDNKKK